MQINGIEIRTTPEGRFFNTAGPMQPEQNYCVPPLDRIDLRGVLQLIAERRYFVLHAPRQTGKTSALLALRDLLNDSGEYLCVYANVEPAQAFREDVATAMETIVTQLWWWAEDDERTAALAKVVMEPRPAYGGRGGDLSLMLARWAQASPKPLVVLFDEVDALVGDTLVSFLRQLRTGYPARPGRFPQSVALCGIRDVRDYRIRTGRGEVVAGGSAFNIKAESLRLGDFSRAEVLSLLGQHTAETGQAFTDDALDAVWTQTRGQPWLVNSLARQACFKDPKGRDRSRPVDAVAIMEAREVLIVDRATHLDQLADKLREDRVRRVVDTMLVGGDRMHRTRDLEYARDLGLVASDPPLRMANPIYAEVVPRELAAVVQDDMWHRTAWYLRPDGSLDMTGLLAAFQQFFRENSEAGLGDFDYPESTAQLLLQGFLHRLVNSGGRVEREYALGRRRTDLLVLWTRDPRRAAGADPVSGAAPQCGPAWPRDGRLPVDRIVIELKILRGSLERTIAQGLVQTADYMDRCGAHEGHLVVFDREAKGSWEERLFRREESVGETAVTVWGA